MIVHPIEPVYDENSEILILGSFPSVKSREEMFFYAHPQNRFWFVMAGICSEDMPNSIDEKIQMLKRNNFALWDVIKSCEITGSADSSIKNVAVNDLRMILDTANIKAVFVNGKKAEALYKKYIEKDIGIKAIALPSTSPANAAWSKEKLLDFWRKKINNAKNITSAE